MQLALIDAYDSFTHNLAHALGTAGARVQVVRCDAIPPGVLGAADAVVFGPGPGGPQEAGVFVPAIRALVGRVPLLGVCLGHQALAVALGGQIRRNPPVHGLATEIHHDATGMFSGLSAPLRQTRYHSLVVDAPTLPPELRVAATSPDGAIMAIAHRTAPAWGVQFHPESVLSGSAGQALLTRFVELARAASGPRATEPAPQRLDTGAGPAG